MYIYTERDRVRVILFKHLYHHLLNEVLQKIPKCTEVHIREKYIFKIFLQKLIFTKNNLINPLYPNDAIRAFFNVT